MWLQRNCNMCWDVASKISSHMLQKLPVIYSDLPNLLPIFHLAHRQLPYQVHSMDTEDFKDYKQVSTNIHIWTIRLFASGKTVDWTSTKEVMVTKNHPDCVFVKDSHRAPNTNRRL
ncbi:hypothetical protein PR048_001696 [Dryococelus australis]|uniref:Uncharacterized protein n=1 Tax=Dryococelus australis TaxID=614101 RepID=A0ABQ9II67_9NEOP|nr:hypothetical protein PR048_001696 [Dryococelus australis]